MQIIDYPQIGEKLYSAVLPNGLEIRVVPKKDFATYYAAFATNYGGAHRRFSVDGRELDTPAGVAHFLEHKMFDMPNGDNALTVLTENVGVYVLLRNAVMCRKRIAKTRGIKNSSRAHYLSFGKSRPLCKGISKDIYRITYQYVKRIWSNLNDLWCDALEYIKVCLCELYSRLPRLTRHSRGYDNDA